MGNGDAIVNHKWGAWGFRSAKERGGGQPEHFLRVDLWPVKFSNYGLRFPYRLNRFVFDGGRRLYSFPLESHQGGQDRTKFSLSDEGDSSGIINGERPDSMSSLLRKG